MIAITGAGLGVTVALEIARRRSQRFNRWFVRRFSVLLKESESKAVLGSTWMLVSAFFVFFIFGREAAIAALLFIAVGDPIAGIVGRRYGRLRVGRKTLEGTAAFALGAGAVGCALAAGGLGMPYWVALTGAAVAAIVELAPTPLDDNLTVPPASAAVMWGLGAV